MTNKPTKKLDDLIADFDTAMLVTRSLEGALRARPMVIAEHSEKGVLYFATRSDDKKLEEIVESPQVAVTMQAKGTYLSLSGEARLLTDQVLADELWSPSMRLWFPDGSSDPELTILLIDPQYAEFWDRTGMRSLEFWWEAGKALVAGETADEDNVSGHDKVKL